MGLLDWIPSVNKHRPIIFLIQLNSTTLQQFTEVKTQKLCFRKYLIITLNLNTILITMCFYSNIFNSGVRRAQITKFIVIGYIIFISLLAYLSTNRSDTKTINNGNKTRATHAQHAIICRNSWLNRTGNKN